MVLGSDTPWAKGPTNFFFFVFLKEFWDGPRWPQDGPKLTQHDPNMAPEWPGIDLKSIKKTQWKIDILGQGAPNKAPNGLKMISESIKNQWKIKFLLALVPKKGLAGAMSSHLAPS